MPKKAKGGGGGGEGKADKEKLPSEVEQMLQTKLNALQAKFDAQVREAEQSYAGRKEAARLGWLRQAFHEHLPRD